jgi:hypothetical protein
MKFPPVQPYSPEIDSPGLEVLILGGVLENNRLMMKRLMRSESASAENRCKTM